MADQLALDEFDDFEEENHAPQGSVWLSPQPSPKGRGSSTPLPLGGIEGGLNNSEFASVLTPNKLTNTVLPQKETEQSAGQDTSDEDSWQNILWREWRNTNDEVYATHLFELVGDEPVGSEVSWVNTLMGMVYGGLLGLLLSVLGALSNSFAGEQLWFMFLGLGIVLGGITGAVIYRPSSQLTYRTWLARLTFYAPPKEVGFVAIILGFGLFFSQINGMLNGAGTENSVAFAILLTIALGSRLMGWLLALGKAPNPKHLHQYRKLWIWWRKRPNIQTTNAALLKAMIQHPAKQDIWHEVLVRLEQQKQNPVSTQKLISSLWSTDWIERFIAGYLLVETGGEAVDELATLTNTITSPFRWKAHALLLGIKQDTTARLGTKTTYLLCPQCLTFCDKHTALIEGETSITYYGCRTCCQSREFWAGQVIAVLDTELANEPVHANRITRLNWLTRRELFDFHAIEIVNATDEDVERFAVQVGNDTDPFRAPRYKVMQCTINPKVKLSENSVRILRRTFGTVE